MSREKLSERRHFRRFELPHGELRAEVGAAGVDATSARVRDISRGGVRLDVKERFAGDEAEHCVVRFFDDGVTPSTTRGRIRRAGDDREDCYVAIEFAQPLESLQLSRTTSG